MKGGGGLLEGWSINCEGVGSCFCTCLSPWGDTDVQQFGRRGGGAIGRGMGGWWGDGPQMFNA